MLKMIYVAQHVHHGKGELLTGASGSFRAMV